MPYLNFGRSVVWKWRVALAVAMLCVTMAGCESAQEPPPATFIPGECWAGALSREPLHCYFLEAAQRAGKIDVAAVYLAPGGGPLYIFLSQTEPISDEVADFLAANAHETEAILGRRCTSRSLSDEERWICLNKSLGDPSWRNFDSYHNFSALPDSQVYESILLRVGGPEARRTEPGWASWSQVWPPGASGASGASDEYDVSDVDRNNIPDPDCRFYNGGHTPASRGCNAIFTFFPDLPLAGWENQDRYLYIQMKDPPEDEMALEALKDRLVPTREDLDLDFVFIPVKHDWAELWRWSVILDRFTVSAGNTAGITDARVTYNHGSYIKDPPMVWLNGVEPQRMNPSGWGEDTWDKSTTRTILAVWAADVDRAGCGSAPGVARSGHSHRRREPRGA